MWSAEEFIKALRSFDIRSGFMMRHIKSVDSQTHTILMIQVENEIAVFGRMSGSSWKVATLTSRGVVASGKFFLREKKESRYAETISDRESTCRTAVSPVRQRGKS